ncbi:serine protease [Shimia abyssi]|uniref:Putative peptidoglycan binding protein n=1 Tax=Shimia abyssi TaxID=1662395 RepID=A0A2P8FAU5_9RHOB|nr:serine protease [Shimia abyssi]PSL18845.1 putative peptidoglycan binding protein [Shimia abyssi]
MLRVFLSLFATLIFCVSAAFAQTASEDVVFVQLEAQPSLTVAEQRIRSYSDRMQDVNGFSLGGGWYAIALGPYRRADAESVLRVYRSEGLIPLDAYISGSDAYRSQFWPVGANALNDQPASSPEAAPEVESVVPAGPRPSDETVREARASEARLTRAERMELQSWLKWAGFYGAAIDGAFGRGTRGSMAAWQRANNFEETGVLTTLQRDTLRNQFFAVLEGMNLQLVTDLDAGIEMQIPLGAVRKTITEYPFVQYDTTGSVPAAKVLLISQEGNQSTLFGLYDIMQTLEIVPLEGRRERKDRGFILIGENSKIVSHTEVVLKDGEVKGFTLVWPAGDEERRTRILGEMQNSLTRIDGSLDPAAGNNPAQDIDLLAGLQVRRPSLSRSGFFIDRTGRVVTTAEAVRGCTKVTLEGDYDADVTSVDEALGIAILTPSTALAPISVATLRRGAPRLQSDIAVSGYSYEGQLGAPTMTFGQLADVKGLGGEQELARLALAPQPGDAGGPVFDAGGSVFGMLLPRANGGGQQLPGQVSFAVNADAIRALLEQEGIRAATSEGAGLMAPEDLTRHASGMTVLVSCWQ